MPGSHFSEAEVAALASRWARAVAGTSYAPMDLPETQQQLARPRAPAAAGVARPTV